MNKWLPGFAIALAILGTGEVLAQQESAGTVKVLYDNYTAENRFTADWGFRCLITGCSHPGVVEIAKRAKEPLNRDVHMVCGGMHLLQMSEAQTREVVREVENGKDVPKNSTVQMPWVRVADDKHGFILSQSGQPFVPWGFNYDHDENGRLLEDYWEKEWPKVEEDFREMKQLGANLVRIHLQFAKFMANAEKSNEANLDRLSRLVRLAERTGLYLDITGLACYRKKDVPQWYDRLNEHDRWEAQAHFWEAVAGRCAKSPAIFCCDLMNEPVVPGGTRKPGDWLGPSFLGSDSGYFVQFVTLEQKDRPRPVIARQWCHRLVAAIRKQDPRHLITVGLVPWSLDRPGLTSGFVPKEIAPELDFLAVHIYPEKGKVKEAMETLSGFAVGKPVVIEEMFPLKCPLPEFEQFLDESRKQASGWIGFYWGKTAEEYRRSNTIQDAIMLRWLEFFQKRAGEAQSGRPGQSSSTERPLIQRIPISS